MENKLTVAKREGLGVENLKNDFQHKITHTRLNKQTKENPSV